MGTGAPHPGRSAQSHPPAPPDTAAHAFLQGCGLPAAWSGRPTWSILATGFGNGLNFLGAWQAWRSDPGRCAMLHYVAAETAPADADALWLAAAPHPGLHDVAAQLATRWHGLVPGFHRLAFDDGQVQLTLCIGDLRDALRELVFRADALFLDGPDDPAPVLKGLARLCRRGTRLVTAAPTDALAADLGQTGFQVDPPSATGLQATYDPRWPVNGLPDADAPGIRPSRCVVVGAGLAGASVAASLARRGWEVEALDAGAQPAAGASGLPAGLMAPHQSPDDNPLSRLSRRGVRMTLARAADLLQPGSDWCATGVLEHRFEDARPAPDLGPGGDSWTREATAAEKEAAGLPAGAPAWWHATAAWVRPARLVGASLDHPRIRFHGQARAAAIEPAGTGWQVRDAAGAVLAEAPLVIVACAHGSRLLLPRLRLHPVRGQVNWRVLTPGERDALPPFPVNGHGHFLPRVPTESGEAWFTGATYGRQDDSLEPRPADTQANLARLHELMPRAAETLEPAFGPGVGTWNGVRCASTDRRPLVGPVQPGLWTSTALGSRGLTFCVLAAELLAARLHGEPWPIERKLAEMLFVERQADR